MKDYAPREEVSRAEIVTPAFARGIPCDEAAQVRRGNRPVTSGGSIMAKWCLAHHPEIRAQAQQGMDEMSERFRKTVAEIYHAADD